MFTYAQPYEQEGLQGLNYNDYPQQSAYQQQPAQQQMSTGSMLNMYNQFSGKGGEAGKGNWDKITGLFGGGGGEQAAGGLYDSWMGGAAGGGASAGGGAGASGGSMWGGVASAGPWAALAAIIVANESNARDRGYRDEDKLKHGQDLLSGEVFHQDMEQRWLPKLGLDEGSKENKWASALLNPFAGMTADPGASWERIKDLF